MEEKCIKIDIPEGYEIDEDRSTFDRIVFRRKVLNYEDISRTLFSSSCAYFVDSHGDINECCMLRDSATDATNCTSKKQAEKLLAINKLMNTAKYLNDGWNPDWSDNQEKKFYLFISSSLDVYINYASTTYAYIVYFKSAELAKEAVKILGEDTIRLALSTDW